MFVFFRDENVEEFLNSIMKELPCIASIDEIELKDEHINGYEDFEIINSSEGEKTSIIADIYILLLIAPPAEPCSQ